MYIITLWRSSFHLMCFNISTLTQEVCVWCMQSRRCEMISCPTIVPRSCIQTEERAVRIRSSHISLISPSSSSAFGSTVNYTFSPRPTYCDPTHSFFNLHLALPPRPTKRLFVRSILSYGLPLGLVLTKVSSG